jgi:hypothetical protein
MEMDNLAQRVVHLISAEALAARPLPTARAAKSRSKPLPESEKALL